MTNRDDDTSVRDELVATRSFGALAELELAAGRRLVAEGASLEALQRLASAEELCGLVLDWSGAATALLEQATVYLALAEHPLAFSSARSALELFVAADDHAGVARTRELIDTVLDAS